MADSSSTSSSSPGGGLPRALLLAAALVVSGEAFVAYALPVNQGRHQVDDLLAECRLERGNEIANILRRIGLWRCRLFQWDRGEIDVKPGDFVSVAIDALEDGYGETRLSRDKAKRLAAWLDLEQALEKGTLAQGVVSGKVKGGLTVMIDGIRA